MDGTIDDSTRPTGKFFRLIEGKMTEWTLPANCKFTEAFGAPDPSGILTAQQVSARDYLETVGR